MAGFVYLVGAGPGDPELITVKGARVLSRAEVVVYDRLCGEEILSLAPPDAELIYVGKNPGHHHLSQREINRLLITRAREGKTVVRLKGGDPFVFGRGGEEAEALAEAGVPFEVIPGVTSAIGVPACAGIPVTHRHHSSSLLIVTGHEDPAKAASRLNWPALARAADTLVFLMARGNLPAISSLLIEHGRSPSTPAAVVSKGTTSEERVVTGSLADISELADAAGATHPAVIVVGEVVSLREKILPWLRREAVQAEREAEAASWMGTPT